MLNRHKTNKIIIAGLLLCSHGLMGCFKPKLAIDKLSLPSSEEGVTIEQVRVLQQEPTNNSLLSFNPQPFQPEKATTPMVALGENTGSNLQVSAEESESAIKVSRSTNHHSGRHNASLSQTHKNARPKQSKHQAKKKDSSKETCLASLHTQLHASQPINCQEFDLHNVELGGLDLQGANFFGANLKGADFSGAYLKDANLARTNLQGAKFVKAQLQKAKFCYADLTDADLTSANVNGAKFRGVSLHNAKYEVYSSKGNMLDDRPYLTKKLQEEAAINTIASQFLANKETRLIVLSASATLKSIHDTLYASLIEAFKTQETYRIVDFRRLFSSTAVSNLGDRKEPGYLFQECLHYLKAPLFTPIVKSTISICENKVLIVFLNTEDKTSRKKSQFSEISDRNKLDLHGKIPLKVKYKWIDKFIKLSYSRNHKAVEIITGRGLNNPDHKMGVLWGLCKNYLLSEPFKGIIQGVHAISKNGGWKVILDKQELKHNTGRAFHKKKRTKQKRSWKTILNKLRGSKVIEKVSYSKQQSKRNYAEKQQPKRHLIELKAYFPKDWADEHSQQVMSQTKKQDSKKDSKRSRNKQNQQVMSQTKKQDPKKDSKGARNKQSQQVVSQTKNQDPKKDGKGSLNKQNQQVVSQTKKQDPKQDSKGSRNKQNQASSKSNQKARSKNNAK